MKKKKRYIDVDGELDMMVSEFKEYMDCMADNICLGKSIADNDKHHYYKKYPFMMTTFILIKDMMEIEASNVAKKLMSDYFKGKNHEQGKV